MKLLRLAFLIITIVLTAFSAVRAQKLTECPPEELKRGQILYGRTVFEGDKPAQFRVRVLEPINHFFWTKEKVVLVRMMDGTPIAGGMSGSPVTTADGRLVGAMAFSLDMFSLKAPLAAITPIRAMRSQLKVLGQQVAGRSVNIVKPTEILGMTNAQVSELNRLLGMEKFKSQNNVSIDQQDGTSVTKRDIKAAESFTGLLADGDVKYGYTCTVTESNKGKFSGCGHPVFGLGPLQYYIYRSSIATTVNSSYDSFKIPNKLYERVGTATYDNLFAVEGTTEILPDIMLPVNLQVTVDGTAYDYNFRVIQHPFLSPILTKMGIAELVGNLWSPTNVATARLTAKIYIKDQKEPQVIYDSSTISMRRMKMSFLEGYANPWEIFSNFQDKLTTIEQSEFKLKVSKVELKLDLWSGNKTLMDDSLAILDSSGKPTDELRICSKNSVVQGMRNEEATVKLVRKFALDIPCDLQLVKPENADANYLEATLIILSGNKYQELDPKKIPKGDPETAEEFLRELSLNQRNPSELFAILILPKEQVAETGKIIDMPEIPNDKWVSVKSLEFLRERSTASEPRVIVIPLGAPQEKGIVNLQIGRKLKLMLK